MIKKKEILIKLFCILICVYGLLSNLYFVNADTSISSMEKDIDKFRKYRTRK